MAAQPRYALGMEELTAPATLKASFAELLATALFVFVGVGSVIIAGAYGTEDAIGAGPGGIAVAITHGLAIVVLVFAIGGISGGHINPAVSFAMVITGRITIARGVMYVIAQLIGATVGALLLRLFIKDPIIEVVPGAGGHAVNTGILTNLGAVGIEAMLTFALVWVIFATAVNPRGLGSLAALAIGFTVLLDHFVGIPLTGASMNPARSFGPALGLPGANEGLPGRWDDQWVYWVGPLIGAAVAAISYYVLYLSDEEQAAA